MNGLYVRAVDAGREMALPALGRGFWAVPQLHHWTTHP